MYQIDNSTAAATQPASSAPGTAGWFTDGSVGGGVAPTIVPAEWLNAVQAELCNAIKNQGLSLSKSTFNQLATAMNCFMPTVGSMRNARMYLAAAASSATFTADQIVVGTTLSAQPFLLSNFSESINLAATGAGGMDTGSAPVSGYVGLYAIYNPTTQAASILAVNASSELPTVYNGGHMPSGYTASALISVWPTNASGQLVVGLQNDRRITTALKTVLSTTTAQSSLTALSIASAVPPECSLDSRDNEYPEQLRSGCFRCD